MRRPELSRFIVLSPYDKREAMSLKEAADRAGKSVSTIKNWCLNRGIGRRVAGGTWCVSRPALEMLLENDDAALLSYHSGNWADPIVKDYFERVGLPFNKMQSAKPTTFATSATLVR